VAKVHNQPQKSGKQQFLRKICVVFVPDSSQHCH